MAACASDRFFARCVIGSPRFGHGSLRYPGAAPRPGVRMLPAWCRQETIAMVSNSARGIAAAASEYLDRASPPVCWFAYCIASSQALAPWASATTFLRFRRGAVFTVLIALLLSPSCGVYGAASRSWIGTAKPDQSIAFSSCADDTQACTHVTP